jgi:DNA-binding LacI/PurR family transcriptional regulator
MATIFFIDEVPDKMGTPVTAKITLQSIADRLGCSAKTVSNAFNRPDQLSPETRERVLAVAAELGYPGPNPLAAGLRRGRVGAIGFAYANPLSYAFRDPVIVALLAGVSAVAEGAGTGLLLVPGSAANVRAEAVSAAVIDGLLIFSMADDDPLVGAAVTRGLPTVVMDEPEPARLARPGAEPPRWVGIDDAAGAAAAAEHLLALGHRRIGVITFSLMRGQQRGPVGEDAQRGATYAVTRRRLEGYRRAATRAGIDWAQVPVVAGTTSSVDEGARAAGTLLDLRPDVTALLCLSDRLAEGAMRALHVRGLDVPGDVSVVGFDDADTAAPLGLTTVSQPHRGKGELATRQLLELMAGRPVEPVTVLASELVVRASTRAV